MGNQTTTCGFDTQLAPACTTTATCSGWAYARTAKPYPWTRALAYLMGLPRAMLDLDNDGVADAVGDDDTDVTALEDGWRRFNVPYRTTLGWLSATRIKVTRGTPANETEGGLPWRWQCTPEHDDTTRRWRYWQQCMHAPQNVSGLW